MSRNIIAATACIAAVLVLAACQTQKTQPEKVAPMAVTATYDLTVLSVSAPATAARGATITVTHTTKNVGTTLAPASTSKFYLCTNNVACGLRNSQNVAALSAGASITMNNTGFTVPAGQALGTNYVVVICATDLATDDKSNNTNSTAIVITP